MQAFIDLHEDIQIYHQTPQLLGYDDAYQVPNFDLPDETRNADIPGYQSIGTRVVWATIFPYDLDGENKMVPLGIDQIGRKIEWYLEFVNAYPQFVLVTDQKSLSEAIAGDRIGLIIHMEGLGSITDPKDIDDLFEHGVRSMGLSWNHENFLCSTCESITDLGLKPDGDEIVRAIELNNIILDLTHSSFETQDMILDTFDHDSIIFSHCGIWEQHQFEQNVRLSIVEEIASRLGLVGLSFLDLLINGKENSRSVHLVRHAEYLRDYPLAAAVGTDYFGMKFRRGLSDVKRIDQMDVLYQQIEQQLGGEFAAGMFFSNALNFLRRTLP